MQSPSRPSTPRGLPQSHAQGQDDLDLISALPSTTQSSPRIPSSPVRFATSKNAFGLSASPASSSSSAVAREDRSLLMVDRSPPSAGSSGKTRLRRPSMLSLAQNASFGSEAESTGAGEAREELNEASTGIGGDPTGGTAAPPTSAASSLNDRRGLISPRSLTDQLNPFAPNPLRPPPQWGPSGFALRNRQGSASHLTFEGLSTTTPPIPSTDVMEDQFGVEADMEDLPQRPSNLRWMPSHLQSNPVSARRKGKARMDEDLVGDEVRPMTGMHRPPFTGRPLPASLVATLISESAPGEHEIQSEARLQRLITSHPRALPFTPRVSRSSRGRFPETVGDEEDDDDFPNRRAIWAARAWTRRDSSSDSDSDDMGMPMDDTAPEPVNSAFAAGMDMDRMNSVSEGWPSAASESGKSTPGMSGTNGHPTPPSNGQVWEAKPRPTRMSFSGLGMVPSPGTGFGLPNAFGGLGMGPGTPIGSPTIERLELATSPGTLSALPAAVASPSLMQYRESSGGSASVRPGKRKAQVDDRFDPYKRSRGSSPSFSSNTSPFPMSPSRPTPAIPIPNSPSYGMYSHMLSTSTGAQGSGRETINLRTKPNHPYTRPMSSRSRAASPALSIGSTTGSLGGGSGGGGAGGGGGGGVGRERGSFSLGGVFALGTPGALGGGTGGNPPQAAPSLGGLGLLSLANRGEDVEVIQEEAEAEEMSREDSAMGSQMDED